MKKNIQKWKTWAKQKKEKIGFFEGKTTEQGDQNVSKQKVEGGLWIGVLLYLPISSSSLNNVSVSISIRSF